jgi:hypothetical protein
MRGEVSVIFTITDLLMTDCGTLAGTRETVVVVAVVVGTTVLAGAVDTEVLPAVTLLDGAVAASPPAFPLGLAFTSLPSLR